MKTAYMLKTRESLSLSIRCLGAAAIACAASWWSVAHACETPAFATNAQLIDLSRGDFKMEWKPVPKATHYEFKYLVRIPEGRTLLQREAVVSQPFFVFAVNELPHASALQIVAEVSAQCETEKSASSFIQSAMKERESACRFDKDVPVMKNAELSWPVIKSAQSYTVCSYAQGTPACKDIGYVPQNAVKVEKAALLSITPICNNLPGKPFYLAP